MQRSQNPFKIDIFYTYNDPKYAIVCSLFCYQSMSWVRKSEGLRVSLSLVWPPAMGLQMISLLL